MKRLRAHSIFADAQIHDIWAFELPSGTNNSMKDLRDVFGQASPGRADPSVRLLFGLRAVLGKLLGLDQKPATPDPLYVDKLTDEDRSRSLVTPGTVRGGFSAVYVFDTEAADEISNRLVHAVSVMSIEALSEGYTVYWAIYLRRRSLMYMRLIDPFRRRYIYPAIIDRFQRTWLKRFPQATTRILGADRPHSGSTPAGDAT